MKLTFVPAYRCCSSYSVTVTAARARRFGYSLVLLVFLLINTIIPFLRRNHHEIWNTEKKSSSSKINHHSVSSSSSSIVQNVAAMSTIAAAAATTSSKYRGAVIFLHGLGDSPAGWSHLEQALYKIKPRLAPATAATTTNDGDGGGGGIRYVFPPAPTDQPLTINGGMQMPGWFDLYDWPIGVGAKDDPTGLRRSVAQVQQEVQKLTQEPYNIPTHKIVIGGFSQGGAVALLSCYHQNGGIAAEGGEQEPHYQQFAGCVGLSAWLTIPEVVVETVTKKEEKTNDTRTSIPLFWGHGTEDDKVLFEQQQFGIDTLSKQFGLPANNKMITATQYPMGHQSCQQEMVDLAEFLDRVLFDCE